MTANPNLGKLLMRLMVLILSAAMFTACLSGSEDDTESSEVDSESLLLLLAVQQATPAVNYASGSGTAYAVNVAIQNDTPTVTGGTAQSFAVSPSLPTGLSMDTSTGIISGTPTATQSTLTTYNITVTYANNTTVNGSVRYRVSSGTSGITCGFQGTSGGCSTSRPYTCNNASFCYSSNAGCRADTSCNYYL